MEQEYLDLEVIEIDRKRKQEAYDSVETGVYVNNRLIEYETVELFEKKMSIALPKGMKPMEEKMAKVKYPSEERPQVIYTSEDGEVNFAFSHYDLPIEPEETLRAIEEIKNIIKKVQPAAVIYETKEETRGGTKLSWFDFKGYGLDSQTYNLMYVTPLDKNMLHGVFNCAYGDGAQWKKAVLPAILSIQEQK